MMSRLLIFLTLFSLAKPSEYHPERNRRSGRRGSGPSPLADKENIDYWMELGLQELIKAKDNVPNESVAKNVIIFIGDGMSIPTVTAARIFKGQFFPDAKDDRSEGLLSTEGNSAQISWEAFPNMGLSKTYSVTGMVPDSASTASAMFSGVKTASWTLGFDSHIVAEDPSSVAAATPVKTMLDWAQESGKSTGFITNTRVTHATPAALYAKSASRNWECDSEMGEGAENLKDIARQMMENAPGNNTDIILGGGLAPFVNYDLQKPAEGERSADFDYASEFWNCHRNDNRSLIKEWVADNPDGKFIINKTQLFDENLMDASKVRGFFSWSYMLYEDNMTEDSKSPNLEEMTSTAIKYLQKKSGDKGFFLMVEGGKIDHAHHSSQATRALRETIGLDNAVKATLKLVSTDDTLIIVTADHAHTFSIGGYPDRFADITGEVLDDGGVDLASDHKPYTIMAYANGPGFKANKVVANGDKYYIKRGPIPSASLDYDYIQTSAVPKSSESHGGDDVGIWATGPMSHYFHSVHEQSYIAHVMSYAACIGPHANLDRCSSGVMASVIHQG